MLYRKFKKQWVPSNSSRESTFIVCNWVTRIPSRPQHSLKCIFPAFEHARFRVRRVLQTQKAFRHETLLDQWTHEGTSMRYLSDCVKSLVIPQGRWALTSEPSRDCAIYTHREYRPEPTENDVKRSKKSRFFLIGPTRDVITGFDIPETNQIKQTCKKKKNGRRFNIKFRGKSCELTARNVIIYSS